MCVVSNSSQLWSSSFRSVYSKGTDLADSTSHTLGTLHFTSLSLFHILILISTRSEHGGSSLSLARKSFFELALGRGERCDESKSSSGGLYADEIHMQIVRGRCRTSAQLMIEARRVLPELGIDRAGDCRCGHRLPSSIE